MIYYIYYIMCTFHIYIIYSVGFVKSRILTLSHEFAVVVSSSTSVLVITVVDLVASVDVSTSAMSHALVVVVDFMVLMVVSSSLEIRP